MLACGHFRKEVDFTKAQLSFVCSQVAYYWKGKDEMKATIVVFGSGTAVVDLDGIRNPTVEDAFQMNGGGAALGKSGMTFEEAAEDDYGSVEKVGEICVNEEPANLDTPLPTDAVISITKKVKGG